MFGINDGQNAQDNSIPVSAAPGQQPVNPISHPVDHSQAASSNPDELLDIKQQALQNLTPLVHTLEQTPEEKFKTTMMLIQASDNAKLIKDAYAAANQITDEKKRAQALIDIINEINYFTNKSS